MNHLYHPLERKSFPIGFLRHFMGHAPCAWVGARGVMSRYNNKNRHILFCQSFIRKCDGNKDKLFYRHLNFMLFCCRFFWGIIFFLFLQPPKKSILFNFAFYMNNSTISQVYIKQPVNVNLNINF